MFGCGHPAGEIHEERGEDSADGLRSTEGSLLAYQQHDEHRRRGNNVSLGKALEQCQLEHLPPQWMKMEEDEASAFRVAEGATFEDPRSQNRQPKYHERYDVVGTVRNPAQPAVEGCAT